MEIKLDDFIVKLKEQYLDDNILLVEKSKFREISGWDSMTGMTVLLMIEEDYGIKIAIDIFNKIYTVEELFLYIKENMK